ncbi:MAG: hypothetical protein JRH11_28340 [Deltaproteobacteria bacterium]|nr:hypothetical protein [Deltaproteobacteria bacterium]
MVVVVPGSSPTDDVPRRRRGTTALIAAGSALFGAGFGLTATIGKGVGEGCGFYGPDLDSGDCTLDSPGNSTVGWSYVPVLGPWVRLATAGNDSWASAFFLATGVAQTVGLGLVVAGIIMKVRNARDARVRSRADQLTLSPILTPTEVGVSLRSSF